MVITRISTYNLHQTTLRDASSVQNELFKLQAQISSGYKTSTFSGLAGQVEPFTALDNKIKRTDMFQQNNQVTIARVETMSKSLDQVVESVTGFKNLLVLRRNESISGSLGFESQLEATWQALAGQMNISLEGRYLFGGTRTDVPPVDNVNFPTLFNSDGIPEDGYYQGSAENTSYRVQDDYDVVQTVRADHPGVQKIFAALAIARDAHAANDDALLTQAFDLAQEGLDGVIDMQVSLNSTKINIEAAADRQDSLRVYWQGVKESLINTDLVSASTQVAINQGLLQASFQAFARINSLQLSDFLR